MKYLLLLLTLTSCSANWHLKKAIAKDPTILTEGVVVETVTDTIYFEVPDTTLHFEVEIPESRDSTIVPLRKVLSSGYRLENDRQIVDLTFNPADSTLEIKATAKGFRYPTHVTVFGKRYRIPHTFERTVIQPRVRNGVDWKWFLLIVVIGLVGWLSRPR